MRDQIEPYEEQLSAPTSEVEQAYHHLDELTSSLTDTQDLQYIKNLIVNLNPARVTDEDIQNIRDFSPVSPSIFQLDDQTEPLKFERTDLMGITTSNVIYQIKTGDISKDEVITAIENRILTLEGENLQKAA